MMLSQSPDLAGTCKVLLQPSQSQLPLPQGHSSLILYGHNFLYILYFYHINIYAKEYSFVHLFQLAADQEVMALLGHRICFSY